ncbi:MAG: hypothetical protein ABI574_05425 [Burkholderiales bacterium]
MREQEIAQCLPGEVATWGDGVDRRAVSASMVLVYDHAGAPAWFAETQVLDAVSRAAQAWSQCGIPSRVVTLRAAGALPAGAVRVNWSDADSRGNFGLANLTQKMLSLGPAAFAMLHERNPRHDAGESLQMVIAHEMGHLYGLMAHSRRCVDVTSYYHDGKGGKCYARDLSQLKTVAEYRASLPTACDIQRCRAANGRAP